MDLKASKQDTATPLSCGNGEGEGEGVGEQRGKRTKREGEGIDGYQTRGSGVMSLWRDYRRLSSQHDVNGCTAMRCPSPGAWEPWSQPNPSAPTISPMHQPVTGAE
ncbi:hypothetical protein HYALB_00010510 [Hymenoscyphus albidus]|uniref:Uncharacterized protein n=1 Tax=Hymenoscyphus albidus TaxID=595503 RepID=A0A9N9QDL0_9HELO|nr:hypothetical protein HYALB_00010510 [Hymenoscyphus albidus]